MNDLLLNYTCFSYSHMGALLANRMGPKWQIGRGGIYLADMGVEASIL